MIRTLGHGRWLTVAEAADVFGVQPGTIYAWTKRYGIEGHKVDGVTHLSELELARCEKARRDSKAAAATRFTKG